MRYSVRWLHTVERVVDVDVDALTIAQWATTNLPIRTLRSGVPAAISVARVLASMRDNAAFRDRLIQLWAQEHMTPTDMESHVKSITVRPPDDTVVHRNEAGQSDKLIPGDGSGNGSL